MSNITTKGFSLSEDERALINKKVAKLLHLDTELQDDSAKIDLTFEHTRRDHADCIICKAILKVPHPAATLVATASADKAVSAFDEVEQELRPQLAKHKAKSK